jgi:two-component system LytT family response regulator
LLKPFSQERFSLALNKVRERIKDAEEEKEKVKKMLDNLPQQEEKTDRVVVKTGSKVKVIPVSELVYLEAQDDYVMLYTEEGKYLKQQTMKYYEDQLDSKQFVRVHRSYIINIDYIAQIEPYEKDSYRIALKNKAVVPVSRSGYKRLKERFNF